MKEPHLQPGRDRFLDLAKDYNLIPIYTELVLDTETPVSAFRKLDEEGYTFLLESAEKVNEIGRYSFLGSRPAVVFQSSGRSVTVTENGSSRTFETSSDPLTELQNLMSRYKPHHLPELGLFSGGAVGYIAYDVVRFFEPTVGEPPADDLRLPEMIFMITGTLLIFDHLQRRLRIVANTFLEGKDPAAAYAEAAAQIAAVLEKLRQPVEFASINVLEEIAFTQPQSNTRAEDFMQNVRDMKEYINAGDIFQIVLSQRFEAAYGGTAIDLYRALRFINPSPYMFCLKFPGDFALVGSSPEVHVRTINGKVEIRPIAGTRRRGSTPEEDAANAAELLADPKERAEHLMLVDLARNDVGRIAEYGSVQVTDFMTIEKYSHVMHIVSNVIGRLREDKNAYEVLRATFPAGTVSGSPKVRAMQIINEMEENKRGTYAGAIGYFGFDGNHDSCIALRTVVVKDGRAYVQAGAGIVADSTPEGEYQETVNKAMGMMRAIERANQIGRTS